MHEILVSIIIPVYKVESYIVRCIDSVLRQTYRHIEVILVDDCSPDRSMQMARGHIVQSSLGKDLRFVYLSHQHNRGLSAARNTGINVATGEFLYFLDSDDYIIPECIEMMVGCAAKSPDVEMVYAGAKLSNGPQWLSFENRNLPDYSDNKDWINHALLKRTVLNMTAWNKLVRRSFIIDNRLYFKEGVIHEDDIWNFDMAKIVSKVAICKHDTYLYEVRETGIMGDKSKTDYHRMVLLKYFANHITEPYSKREISFIFHFTHDHFPKGIPQELSTDFQHVQRLMIKRARGKQKFALWMYYKGPRTILYNYHVLGRVVNAIGEV